MHTMQVVTSIGEKYEVLGKASDAVIAADRAWASNPDLADCEEAFLESVRTMNAARDAVDNHSKLPEGYRTVVIHKDGNRLNNDIDNLETVDALERLGALLADAMDRGEREAFDEHYDSQVPPCEVDVVELDPWVEEAAAVAEDLKADAAAREIEAQS